MTVVHASAVPEAAPDCNHLAAAYAAQQDGDLAAAARHFAAARAQNPHDAEIAAACGLFLHDQTDHAAALPLLQQAHAADPLRLDLALALAASCNALGKPEIAEQVLTGYCTRRQDSAPALQALAFQHGARHDFAAAASLADEACRLAPAPPELLRACAGWHAALGDFRAALEILTQHLAATPDDAPAWRQIGEYWQKVQEPHKAEQSLARYHDLMPNAPLVTAAAYETLSVAYVRALFDGYADRFNADLENKLQYRAPQLLYEAVRYAGNLPEHPALLDLGCGTGLAVQAFAPLQPICTGIDLSPRMLAQAEKTGLYHRLIAGDVVAELDKLKEKFDLVIAADVLVYLGDLTPLFAQLRPHLNPNGLFAATVEHHLGQGNWFLQPQRRYAHTEAYLRRLAAASGLSILAMASCAPRHENNRPVDGLLFILQVE